MKHSTSPVSISTAMSGSSFPSVWETSKTDTTLKAGIVISFSSLTPHGTANLEKKTSSTRLITNAVMDLYDRIVDEHLLVRRITITANKLVDEKSVKQEDEYQQLDLFTDYEAQRKKQAEEEEKLERERRMQEAMLSIKKKFGKNAVLKGMNLEEGATAKDRNEQIGGHKA